MCLNFEQLKDQIILKKLEDTMTTEKVKKQDIDLCNKMVNSENDLSIIRGCESLKKTTQHTTGKISQFFSYFFNFCLIIKTILKFQNKLFNKLKMQLLPTDQMKPNIFNTCYV